LVKSTFQLPGGVQGDWNQYIKVVSAQPFVIQRSTEPARYEMAQMNLPPVFKFMNDMTDDPATAVCGHCGFEMKCAMGTVRTRERARDRTFERFGAFLAKRRDDAGCLCFANIA